MTDEVLAIGDWSTNADMICDVARLGYIQSPCLDMTYGAGNFLDKYRPDCLVTNDIDLTREADFHWDCTDMPQADLTYATVVLDLPTNSKADPRLPPWTEPMELPSIRLLASLKIFCGL